MRICLVHVGNISALLLLVCKGAVPAFRQQATSITRCPACKDAHYNTLLLSVCASPKILSSLGFALYSDVYIVIIRACIVCRCILCAQIRHFTYRRRKASRCIKTSEAKACKISQWWCLLQRTDPWPTQTSIAFARMLCRLAETPDPLSLVITDDEVLLPVHLQCGRSSMNSSSDA
jgi:hypothetical protein